MDIKKAGLGDRVKIHYTVKLAGGEVVGTSKKGKPLTFTIGKGAVIKGLEHGMIGMQKGESRTLEVAPEQGYGARNEALVMTIKREELPADVDPEVGRTVQYLDSKGGMTNFIIAAVGEGTVTLDANHPFAGRILRYEIVLLDFPQW